MTTPQNSLTWFKFEVGWQQSSTDDMSNNALAIDTRLTYQAWSAPDGSCAVPMKRFLRLCEKAAADAELLYKELVDSERWVRSEDRKSLIAVWLLQKRAVADAIIEKRRRAGKASGVSRQPGKAARTAKPRPLREPKASAPMTADAPEHVLNTCSAHVHELTPEPLVYAHMHGIEDADAWRNSLHDNAPNMCSTPAEHVLNREACTSSSLPTVEEEEEQARTLAHAATAPPASHADGAAGAVARADPVVRRVQPGHILRLQADHELEKIAVPAGWASPVAGVLERLGHAAPDVDVERGLFRAFSRLQTPAKPQGHVPLLDEVVALLDGADHRDGWLDVAKAPRAIALALHGALIMPPMQPRVLRALAIHIARDLSPDETDPLRVACFIAGEFAHAKRSSAGYMLTDEPVRDRLLGHRVKAGLA